MTTARAQAAPYEGVVDVGRYPIGDPASPRYRALVLRCREQLRDRGVAQLDGFLTPAAVAGMLDLAGRLTARAWASDQAHTVYFEPPDDSARRAEGPAGQPGRRRQAARRPGTLAVFRGQHALHRVTPVSGPRPRVNSVLTYGERPGMKLNRLTQELFYGRTA